MNCAQCALCTPKKKKTVWKRISEGKGTHNPFGSFYFFIFQYYDFTHKHVHRTCKVCLCVCFPSSEMHSICEWAAVILIISPHKFIKRTKDVVCRCALNDVNAVFQNSPNKTNKHTKMLNEWLKSKQQPFTDWCILREIRWWTQHQLMLVNKWKCVAEKGRKKKFKIIVGWFKI